MFNYQIDGLFNMYMNDSVLKGTPKERLVQFIDFWKEKASKINEVSNMITSMSLSFLSDHDSNYIWSKLNAMKDSNELKLLNISDEEKKNDELINKIVEALLTGKLKKGE